VSKYATIRDSEYAQRALARAAVRKSQPKPTRPRLRGVELEAAIVQAIRDGLTGWDDILVAVGFSYYDEEDLNVVMVRLRQQGVIDYEHTGRDIISNGGLVEERFYFLLK